MEERLEEGASTQEPARLDLRGLICPMPVLLTRKHLRRLPPGASLEVDVTDARAPADIELLLPRLGCALVERYELGDRVRLLIARPAG